MAVTTLCHVADCNNALTAGALVFFAGLAMAPVFPSTVALIGDRFPVMTSTAIGIAVTSGWIGLASQLKANCDGRASGAARVFRTDDCRKLAAAS